MPTYRICQHCGEKESEEKGPVVLYTETVVDGLLPQSEYFAFHEPCYPMWVKEGCP